MAPRTGPDGLLAVAAKTKSAAVAALLVAAALLLAGCGGGDYSEKQASTTAPSAASTPAHRQGAQSAEAKGEGKKQDSTAAKAADERHSQGSASKPDSTKHGKRIALPEGEPEPGPTPAERAQATVVDISLSSPSLGAPSAEGASLLPANYTCTDTWPTLTWAGVPSGTEELILLVLAQEPINGALFYDWGVAGINPGASGIDSAKLPAGAVIGKNGLGKTGYSICPAPGKTEIHLFTLYALPESLHPAKGFDPDALRDRILEVSGNAGLMAVSAAR
jgi:phosphatidylethanolamine-binding protein (PEBP) family uncharacterized protein